MLDPLVKIINVRSVTGFDPLTLLPSKQVQTTYMVGAHGPFLLVTPEGEYSKEYVEQHVGMMVATLRATGALPPA